MEPQKPRGNRKVAMCEHVDRFMRQPTGPHSVRGKTKINKIIKIYLLAVVGKFRLFSEDFNDFLIEIIPIL